MLIKTSRKSEPTESEWRHKVRKKCKASLFYLCHSVCGMTKFTEDLHLPLCNYAQLLPWSGGPPVSNRKMAWAPREHFKSSVFSRGLPLWLIIHDRNTTIALVSAKHINTKKWLRWIGRQIEHNEVLRWAFPEIRPGDKWDAEEMAVARDIGQDTEVQATVTAYSIKGGLASQHHQHGVLDDLLNEKTAYSDVERDRAIDLYDHFESVLKGWYESTMTLVGTPWPGYDVLAHAMETEAELGKRLYWGLGARGGFRMSPELNEEPYINMELVPQVEARLKKDKVIFTEECPEEKLQVIKRKNPMHYMYQYLCTTPQDEDNGFDVRLVRDFAQMTSGKLKCDCHSSHEHDIRKMIVVGLCDPALSLDRKACESAIVVLAVDPTCGCRFNLYEWGGRVGNLELVDKICAVATEWKAYMTRFGIEDVHFQTALKAWTIERQAQGKIPLHIEVMGVKPKKRKKDLRITAQQPYVQTGLWHKRPDMLLTEGVENWLWQLQVWPNQPKKRDRIDAWAYIEDALEGIYSPHADTSVVGGNPVAAMNQAIEEKDMRRMKRRSESN